MSEIKIIGQMDNTQDHTFESANRVYDSNGIIPTIPTICDGGHEPKVLEIKELGFIEKGTGKHQSNIVYSSDGLCPTIPAMIGVKQPPTMHVKIVAMRGRDPENPSDRTPGNPNLEQRLEPNSEGICNTITTVQKDNLVLETKNVQCMRMIRTEEGKELRKKYENHEIKHGFNEYREAEPRKDGICNTISTVQKDCHVIETKCIKVKQATKDGYVNCQIGGGGRFELSDKSNTKRSSDRERKCLPDSDNGEYP